MADGKVGLGILNIDKRIFIYIYFYKYKYIYIYLPSNSIQYTSSTAQGGGGSFRIGTSWERLLVVNHEWQRESTDGLKGGWRCLLEWLQWLQWSPHPQLLEVVWCSAAAVVVVTQWSCSCGVV